MSPEQVSIRQSAEKVGQYELLEVAIEIGGVALENPFDPREIDLVGVFRTPSGRTVTVPAFYYLPYERSQGERGEEVLTRAGEGQFRIRFAGREVGEHSYQVVARDESGGRNRPSSSSTRRRNGCSSRG